MEENNSVGASTSKRNTAISEETPVGVGPSVAGGLYTLADILTSINKKQSEIATPSVKKRSSIFTTKEDDANNFEWKEYQAKRLQAIKILKQEKESRLKEEMKRLGLKTVTPDLRARLEAQFQYLHEALLPDAGLEEEEAAAKKGRPSKKKSKKSASVHWSTEVTENSDKASTSKSKTSISKKSKSNTAIKGKVVTLEVSKSSSSTKQMGKKKSKKLKKSGSTSAIGLKSKSKKLAKPKVEEANNFENAFNNELERLENVEAGAKNLLSRMSGKFGSMNESPDTTNQLVNSKNVTGTNVTKHIGFTSPGVNKVKSKMSAPKLKAPSGQPQPKAIPKTKSKQRSSSAGKIKSQTKQHTIQSSGYGQTNYIQKRSASLKGSMNINDNNDKKNVGSVGQSKSAWIPKKPVPQQNNTNTVGARNVQRVVQTKSELTNAAPKLKATPIVGKTNITKPITPAGKSKSYAAPTNTTTTKLTRKSETTAAPSKPHLDTTAASRNTVNIRANKSVSFNNYTVPVANSTPIAELYPVNSRIVAGVSSVVDKGASKDEEGSKKGNKTEKASSISAKKSDQLRPAQRKPPKFPTVDLCNVFPGTRDWDVYWEKFNGQISTYYKEMDDYLKSMNDLTMDLEDYSKELKKIQMGNQAFALKLGMNPNYKSSVSVTPKNFLAPQFTNKSLEPGIYNINGYIIKSGGARIPGLKLSTVGDEGFSLTLDLDEIDVDPQLITVETEYNVMTISVPVKHEEGKVRIIQIRVPSRANVNDLNLKEVQRISKNGATTKTLVIEGH